jgi:methylated-DNA-[protein]-cysteine S-methyltransferase
MGAITPAKTAGARSAGPGIHEDTRASGRFTPGEALVYLDTIESPAGALTFAVDADGALLRVSFGEGRYERTVEQELVQDGYRLACNPSRSADARRQLMEYATGERRTFAIPLALKGTAWQVTVWRALTRIPYGETRSYAQVAAMAGRPGAARAVGRANATNRLPIVVPCHRVIGSDGSLSGFAGGTHLKTRLLEHERIALPEMR